MYFIKNNYDKKTYKELANDLSFTERQVRGKINNMGLSKLRKFDNKYFEVIDNCEKAYWLGFLYADGYIINNKSNRNTRRKCKKNADCRFLKRKYN